MSHRGGGGEAVTHTFSMPEPSLPGPGQALTVFSREDLEKPQNPMPQASLTPLPKGPRFQTEAFICSAIFI